MSARTSIHSSIEAAMGSLDLTLESELTLFRNRYSQAEASSNPIQSLAESASSEQNPFAFPSATPESGPFAHHEDDTILDMRQPAEVSSDLAQEAARLLDVTMEDADPSDLPTAIDDNVEVSAPETLDEVTEIPAGAIVHSKALLPSDDGLGDSATLDTYTDPSLDDYLESSEALLKHLDTPAPSNQLENSVSLKWFIWAAGATLVLSVLAAFFLQNVFQTPKSPETPPPSASTETSPSQTDKSSPGVNSPDLSSKEFQEVKPGSLAELPTPEAPANNQTTPAPSEETSQSAPETPSESSQTGSSPGRQYYVVAEYVDEASLSRVKAIAPEAKLVLFTGGQKIQLQKFTDEATARTAAAEFEQKGLSVDILATAE